MEKIRILLALSIPEHRKELIENLSRENDFLLIGEATDGANAVKKTEHLLPDIVIMDIFLPVMDGITATEMISLSHPNIGVILVDEQEDNNNVKQAMLAGAGDFLFMDKLEGNEIAASVRRLYLAFQTRIARYQTLKSNEKEQILKLPQVISIYGAKGGAGKTTLAVNLAVTLARETKRKVAIVDLNLQFGDVVVYMDTKPRRTIAELVQERNQWDTQLINSYLLEHSSGVKILPAPLRPEDAELVTAEQIEKIISILRQSFDYIVIDSPPYISDTLLTALDVSNQIILLMPMDLPAVKNAKLSLNMLDSLHHSGKTRLVINRGAKQFGVEISEVEKTIDFLAAAEIPSDGNNVVNAANKGVPFVLSHPQAAVSKAINKVAQLVIEDKGYQQDLRINKEKGNKSPIIKKLFR